jgi:nucleoside 2-deoxyribosyltransferase
MSEPQKIYVASSWRNEAQPEVVRLLRQHGFDVYDFRDPLNDKGAFRWSDLGIERPEDWSPERCIEFLAHPRAEEGFRQDFDAMRWADACVLVLPAGRSANLEAGWFVGQGKPLVVLKDWGNPDLMYKMATRVVAQLHEIPAALRGEPSP